MVALLVANEVMALPNPSSSTETMMRPGTSVPLALLASPTTMLRFCCLVFPAALAGLPMIMIWYGSAPSVFGPVQLAALPS
jgi:hypothetical protein